MQIELQCPCCGCDFVHEPGMPLDGGADYMEVLVRGHALGDGGTLEDSLHAALSAAGEIRCPECDAAVPVNEEDLGRLAMVMLASW